jgi:hypothetical protein
MRKRACRVQADVPGAGAGGVGGGALAGVEVLSARRGEKIDPAVPPSLMPDTNEVQGGMLHQVWQMNADGPDWVFYVDATMPAARACCAWMPVAQGAANASCRRRRTRVARKA